MSFIKSTICYVYNSVKKYFTSDEKAEEDPTIYPNSRNLPKSIDDFDQYIEYLTGELQVEMNKVKPFKEQNDLEGIYQSTIQIKTIEICISRLHNIKLKFDTQTTYDQSHDALDAKQQNDKNPIYQSNSADLTDNTINELKNHIEQLNEEHSKEQIKVRSCYQNNNLIELNEFTSQMYAIENCIALFTEIKAQLEEQKIELTTDQDSQNEGFQKIKQCYENLNKNIDDLNKSIENLQAVCNEELRKARAFKIQGNKAKAKGCLVIKKIKENSIKKFSFMKMELEQLKKRLQMRNLKLADDINNQSMGSLTDPNQVNEMFKINFGPSFDEQIDEDYEKLDVSQVETTPKNHENKEVNHLMDGFT